jgi:hypothetical protein
VKKIKNKKKRRKKDEKLPKKFQGILDIYQEEKKSLVPLLLFFWHVDQSDIVKIVFG